MDVTLVRLVPIKRSVSPCLAPVGPKLNNCTLPESTESLFFLHEVRIPIEIVRHINTSVLVLENLIIIVDYILINYFFGTTLKLSNDRSASKSPGPWINILLQ